MNTDERILLKRLWDFNIGIGALRSTIGVIAAGPHLFDPSFIIDDIEKVQQTLRRLQQHHHPDYLSPETLDTMCSQLDTLSRKFYIAYASCKATGLRDIYKEELYKLLSEVHDVISPIFKDINTTDLFDIPEFMGKK